MTDNQRATHFAKLEIAGTLEVLTGLHIGTGGGFSAIGATDKPVVRDPLTKLPLIPGTSLKGKVRTLLSRQHAADSGSFADKPTDDHPTIRRLFGDTEEFMTGRLIFRDTRLANKDELVAKGAKTLTEIKFENTINRITAIANPRQMERVIPGSRFDFSLIYEVSFGAKRQGAEPTLPSYGEIREDFETVVRGLRLLELDYLGGSGTRGYGRVKFHDLSATVPVGDLDATLLRSLNDQLAAF